MSEKNGMNTLGREANLSKNTSLVKSALANIKRKSLLQRTNSFHLEKTPILKDLSLYESQQEVTKPDLKKKYIYIENTPRVFIFISQIFYFSLLRE